MAERKFEYENVAEIYKKMQSISGDSGNADSIAGILHNIDEEVHLKVDVVDEAIYGELGKQMLLDWDNTSSNFDNFVTNFNNWATLVAQSAGNYAKFEQDIAGFKDKNPLGVTSGGITDAYTNTGYYSFYTRELADTAATLVGDFVSYNGLGYFDTNMVALEKQRKLNAGISFGIQTFATVLSLVGLKGAGGAGSASSLADDAVKVAAGSGDDIVRATVGQLDDWTGQMAKMTTKEQASFVNGLVKDGSINNADDLLALFKGKESVAKTVLGSGNYRALVKGFGSTTAKVAPTVTASIGDDLATASGNSLINSAKNKVSSMSDDAITKVLSKALGVPEETIIASAIDGGTTIKQVALSQLSNTKVATAFANFGTKAATTSSTLYNAAKAKIATMSDDAIVKILGKDVAELCKSEGVSFRQYALSHLSNTKVATAFANFGTKVSNASSSVLNAAQNVHLPNGAIPTSLGLGTNLIGEGLLDDVDFSNVSVIDSPYVE